MISTFCYIYYRQLYLSWLLKSLLISSPNLEALGLQVVKQFLELTHEC